MTSAIVGLLVGITIVGLLRVESETTRSSNSPLTRNLEIEALKEMVAWPNPTMQTVVTLAGAFIAARQGDEGYTYFHKLAESHPGQPLFLTLEGTFQARIAKDIGLLRRVQWVKDAIQKLDQAVEKGHPLSRYFRGLVLAELPDRFHKTQAAIDDLEWVLKNSEPQAVQSQDENRLPPGLRRNAFLALAKSYTKLKRDADAKKAVDRSGYSSLDVSGPLFITDAWVNAKDGFRFVPSRLVEPAPGVFVAQGYDFADIAFAVTGQGVVAIDAGTTSANAKAALEAFQKRSNLPISHVLVTHAHWDHIGGIAAFKQPDTKVIARANFSDELRRVNETGVPFRYFFGAEAPRQFELSPDRLINDRTTLTVGDTEFVFYPVRGGETEDAMLIYLPKQGVLFVGDVMMPYLGAPFLAEGSPEGLLETLSVIRELHPRVLVHGHPPLTENFTIAAIPGLESALRVVYEQTVKGIKDGKTLADVLSQNLLPEGLQFHPEAAIPFLVMRDHFIQRVYHQRVGYWKPDGEGLEIRSPADWAAILDLMGGHAEKSFVRAAEQLLKHNDAALAFRVADSGILRYPKSVKLNALRSQALHRLRERYQTLDPFKFIIYSELSGVDLPPPQ